MTAQDLDILINESDVDLRGFQPLDISGAHDRKDCFPVVANQPESNRFCTALWRGYIATLRLHENGQLELVQYEFPYADGESPQICNALFEGDFEMAVVPFFEGPQIIVPFHGGVIVRNRDEWTIEDQTLTAVVLKSWIEQGTDRIIGVVIRIQEMISVYVVAYAPFGAMTDALNKDPAALIGKTVSCEILARTENGALVASIESLADDPTGGRHE